MQPHEVKAVITEVLDQQQKLHKDKIDDVVLQTIVNLLTSFGFNEQDREELRADFAHLRKWRKSFDQASSLSFKTVVTMITMTFITVIGLGLKAMLWK